MMSGMGESQSVPRATIWEVTVVDQEGDDWLV